MVRGLVQRDEVRPPLDALRKQDLADFAGARRRGREQTPGTRTEPRDERHDAPERRVVQFLDGRVDFPGFLRGNLLRNDEQALRRHVRLREHVLQQG